MRRLADSAVAISQRLPWLGWAAWFVFIIAVLLRTHPRRFGSTFQVYLDSAQQFWTHQPIYDPATLGGFLYAPASLVALLPFLLVSPVAAAAIGEAISAVVLSWASVALMRELLRDEPRAASPLVAAGFLLMINIPAAWFNFKGVQAAIVMTGAMMFAAAAMMRARWAVAALWLFLAALVKPLAIVMMLLCGALVPRMRLPLIAALAALLLLPFLAADPSYVAGLYRAWLTKMLHLGSLLPDQWPYQADFSTMLDSLGIVVPRAAETVIRAAAALATLTLAWRVSQTKDRLALGFAILLLTGCYVTLFGPRNEYLSFLVLTPSVTALALLLLGRSPHDSRAWLLILATLALGFFWTADVSVDRVLKPAIVLAIYVWLGWLMLAPERWRALVRDGGPAAPTL